MLSIGSNSPNIPTWWTPLLNQATLPELELAAGPPTAVSVLVSFGSLVPVGAAVALCAGHHRGWLAVGGCAALLSGCAHTTCLLCDPPMFLSVSCAAWRGADAVALLGCLALLAAVSVGLASCALAVAVAVVVPARGLYIAVPGAFNVFNWANDGVVRDPGVPYSQLGWLLFWSVFVVVGSVLAERWSEKGVSVLAIFSPELRGKGLVPSLTGVVLPWLMGYICLVAPCISPAAWLWPSVWLCRVAVATAVLGLPRPPGKATLATWLRSCFKGQPISQKGGSSANSARSKTTRSPVSQLAPVGRPKLLNNWAKKKLGALLKEVAEPSEWNPNPLGSSVEFVKLHIEGKASVTPTEGEVPASRTAPSRVSWTPKYSLVVDTHLKVIYPNAKVTCPAVCRFALKHDVEPASMLMDVDLNGAILLPC
jgi:hypothetical protein|eukprot:COSAG01_NODE_4317_length_5137_cov_16.810441_3_plen_424_part_00